MAGGGGPGARPISRLRLRHHRPVPEVQRPSRAKVGSPWRSARAGGPGGTGRRGLGDRTWARPACVRPERVDGAAPGGAPRASHQLAGRGNAGTGRPPTAGAGGGTTVGRGGRFLCSPARTGPGPARPGPGRSGPYWSGGAHARPAGFGLRTSGLQARGRRGRDPFPGPPKPPLDVDAGPVPSRAGAMKGLGAMMWRSGMAE